MTEAQFKEIINLLKFTDYEFDGLNQTLNVIDVDKLANELEMEEIIMTHNTQLPEIKKIVQQFNKSRSEPNYQNTELDYEKIDLSNIHILKHSTEDDFNIFTYQFFYNQKNYLMRVSGDGESYSMDAMCSNKLETLGKMLPNLEKFCSGINKAHEPLLALIEKEKLESKIKSFRESEADTKKTHLKI